MSGELIKHGTPSSEIVHVLLVEDNPADARLVKETLSEVEGQQFRVEWVQTLLQALQQLSQSDFDVALVDLTLPDSQGLVTFSTIHRHAPGLPVVLLTGLENDALALAAVEKGAQDYLIKGKQTSHSLARALRYAVARRSKQPEHATQQQLASSTGVMGAKGGVGVTAVASHLALEMASRPGETVLLADLDTESAGAAFLFSAQAPQSLLDATANLHRLDTELWKGLVCRCADKVDLLAGPGSIRLGEELAPDRVRPVLRFARRLYSRVVLDLGRCNNLGLSMTPELDRIILVATPDLQALFEAKRAIQRLTGVGYDQANVHLVINRMRKSMTDLRSNVEKSLGCPVYAEIPEAPQEFSQAYAVGRLLDNRSSVRQHISQLASKMAGRQMTAPRPRLRFFGLYGRDKDAAPANSSELQQAGVSERSA